MGQPRHRADIRLFVSLLLATVAFAVLLAFGRSFDGPKITLADHYAAVPTVAFALGTSSASESASTVNVEVRLSAIALGHDARVDYAVTGGTAVSGADFALADGTLTFPSGTTSQSIAIQVFDDLDETGGRTIILELSNPVDAILGIPATHTVLLLEDDFIEEPDDDLPDDNADAGGGAGAGGGGTDLTGGGTTDGATSDSTEISAIVDLSGDQGLDSQDILNIGNIITDIAGSGDTDQQDAVSGIIGDLAASTESSQRDAAVNIIGDLAASAESGKQDAAADLIGSLARSTESGKRDAASNIIGGLALSNDASKKDAGERLVTGLALSTDAAKKDAGERLVTGLALSNDASKKDAGERLVTGLALSNDASKKDAGERLVTGLALSNDATKKDAGERLVTGLALSNDASKKDAGERLVTGLALSNDASKKDAGERLVTGLALSTDASKKDAGERLVSGLALSTEPDKQNAVAGLVNGLVRSTETDKQEAVQGLVTGLAVSGDSDRQQAAANVGVLASKKTADASDATNLFKGLAANPTALDNLAKSMPVDAFTRGNPPVAGQDNWAAMASTSGLNLSDLLNSKLIQDSPAANVPIQRSDILPEGAPRLSENQMVSSVFNLAPGDFGIEILSKFAEPSPGASVEIQVLDEIPEGTPPLPEDQIVNSVFILTPVNFGSVPVANSMLAPVEKSFLDDNDIHPWSISFNRFNDETREWVSHTGKLVGETGGQLVYLVSTPRFSLWSISGSREIPKVRFRTQNLRVDPARPVEGEGFRVLVDVSNRGADAAEYTANLWRNDQIDLTQAVRIEANSSVTVIFDLDVAPGDYNVRVGGSLGAFTVSPAPPLVAPEEPTPTTPPAVAVPEPTTPPDAAPPQPTPVDEDDGLPMAQVVGIIVGVVVVLAVAITIGIRRRSA